MAVPPRLPFSRVARAKCQSGTCIDPCDGREGGRFGGHRPLKAPRLAYRSDRGFLDQVPSGKPFGNSMSIVTVLGLVLAMCSNVGLVATSNITLLPHPCDSQIYCYGDLLKTVQMARLHKDSKYFVDMTLKNSPDETYVIFEKLMEETNNEPSRNSVKIFVNENFDDPGTEFVPWKPDDWEESPDFLNNIVDPEFRSFAASLHELWKDLGRKISADVATNPELFSQIYVNKPVVVPGGRFREFYYWDSYWTIDGLLLSGMTTTVRGMLENFLQMVDMYGMVPNGGRIYYTRRSQPPYMIPMIKLYVDHTNDTQFVKDNLAMMEKEFHFWVNNRSVEVTYNGSSYSVAQYYSKVGDPRPESYREDYEQALNLSLVHRNKLYVELKSGAESGWDYSSRWFMDGAGGNTGTIKNLAVTSIAPVDLNSLLCYNAKILADYHTALGDHAKAVYYNAQHMQRVRTINELFWDKRDGVWYDVNIRTMKKRRYFYLSNLHPLWTGSFDQSGGNGQAVVAKVIAYLKKQKVLDFVGGVPTSTLNTGQQWDYPNAWAPLQHLIVMALQKNKNLNAEADGISLQLAQKWVTSNWLGYVNTSAMYEKYNVLLVGAPGGGGEYFVQLGFGWTNGVALRFLNDFGDRLHTPDANTTLGAAPTTHPGAAGRVLLAVAVVCFFSIRERFDFC